MRKLLLVAALELSVVAGAYGQQSIVDQFESRSQTLDGFTLPYRLFVPANYAAETKYPIVLALHGAGERGADNERHIVPHRLATSWADPENQAENPAFVVAPQVPPGGRWTADLPVGESDFNQEELTTLAILDSLAREFNIDPERVYVTGLSMGGHGTWDLISRLPDRFAAAIPMSGNADPTQATRLLHIPIWTFHGESDTVVRPFGARGIVQNMEDSGRDVVYTDCQRSPVQQINFDCPGVMSTSELAGAIDAHADLIFTAAERVGHGPWNVWYDHPLLAGWLFSKQRVITDAIQIDQPVEGATWSGEAMVSWSSAGPESDTVEVWLSADDGGTWETVGEAGLTEGGLLMDTSAMEDAALARIRLFVRNQEGRIYGRQTSSRFTIDNAGDGIPYLAIEDEFLRFEPLVTDDMIQLEVVAADPEGMILATDVLYSVNGGQTFGRIAMMSLTSGLQPQTVSINLAELPNSAEAALRIDMSDGTHATSRTTASFVKQTPRIVNDYTEQVAGNGVGTIRLHFVEPNLLTSHRYRITFDDDTPAGKRYAVHDLDVSTTVLTDIPLSDGVLESPIFDGMSLIVQDLEVGMPNLDETGWIAGESDLGVSISGGSVLIAILRVQLLETENDYEITIAETVSDTSVAMFAIPSEELYFSVTSRPDNKRKKVLFKDAGKDGQLNGGDLLYILEEDSEGELAPAWELRFSSDSDTVLPAGGDKFLFVPLRKLSSEDVFEFVAAEGVGVERPSEAEDLSLWHYPNPFDDSATIGFSVARASDVTLRIYDVLGRHVGTVLDQMVSAGSHVVNWDASIDGVAPVASGIYLFRLTATGHGGVSRTAERIAVRIRP